MGGHGAGVTKQLNYRRSQTRKRPEQEKTYGSLKKEPWVDPIQATSQQLLGIRRRLKKDRKRKRLQHIFAFIGVLFLLLLFLVSITNNNDLIFASGYEQSRM